MDIITFQFPQKFVLLLCLDLLRRETDTQTSRQINNAPYDLLSFALPDIVHKLLSSFSTSIGMVPSIVMEK